MQKKTVRQIIYTNFNPRTKLNLTLLNTLRDRSINVTIDWRFDWTRMKEALEIATSPLKIERNE